VFIIQLVIALITFKQPYKAFDEKIVNLKVENFAKNNFNKLYSRKFVTCCGANVLKLF
jgi:hypothetical protein